MIFYWIFLILAITAALFADRIDQAASANKTLKKWLTAICCVPALVSVSLILSSILTVRL